MLFLFIFICVVVLRSSDVYCQLYVIALNIVQLIVISDHVNSSNICGISVALLVTIMHATATA